MSAEIREEVNVQLKHEPGAMAGALKAVADAKVRVIAFCGWGMGQEGTLMFVADKAPAARKALKKAGYKAGSNKVVVAKVADKVGAAAKLAAKAGAKGVNINYAYASGTGKGQGIVVLASESAAKLKKALS